MTKFITGLLAISITIHPTFIAYADDRALQAERREAQKQRQQHKNERSREHRDALREFRNFANDLRQQYNERARELDTEYRLQKEELRADRQLKIADVDAELQKNISGLFLNPAASEQASMEKIKAEMKAYSDKAFAIKQEAARLEHEEYIHNEQRKHELLSERDDRVMGRAEELGLLSQPEPILASPLGGALTENEERWNEREHKEVQRLSDSNQRYLGEYLYGKELRSWQIENEREDFRLKTEKEEALHALNSEQTWLNSLMFSPNNAGANSTEDMAARLAEISRKSRKININYNKEGRQLSVLRREQRREIMRR